MNIEATVRTALIRIGMMTTAMLFISSGIVSAQPGQDELDYAPNKAPTAQLANASLPVDPAAINVVSGNLGSHEADFKNAFMNHMNLWMAARKPGACRIDWKLQAPADGIYEVDALVAGKGSRISLTCNGERQETVVELNPARSLGWERVSLGNIRLKAGENSLRLNVEAAKSFKLDALELAHPDVKADLLKDALAMRQKPKWFKDAGYGLMFQWTNRATPIKGPIKPWEEKVNDFDLDGFIQTVEDSGAAYVLWSVTWGNQYISAPIESLDAIIQGRTTKRDLLGEMADALHERGIKLIFYYHYGYDCNHSIDADWMKASGGYKSDKTEFYKNWMAVVSEIGNRYGDKLHGWWFDGGQRYYNCHFDNTPGDQGILSAPFKELTLAARSGNGNRIVAYNSWIKPRLTEYQDFYAGEGAHAASGLDSGSFPSGPQQGLQSHGCFIFEKKWGHIEQDTPISKPKYSLKKLSDIVKKALEEKSPLSINLEMYEDGSVSPESVALLKKLKTAVRGETNSHVQTPSPYDGSWESLQRMPVPGWFDDGKLGIFIHWGPSSAMGFRKGGRGYSEHVPKEIYRDPSYYYPVVKERWGANPPDFGYKDVIPEFKAENWDPDAWAKLFADVGFKYCVMTAEHHDGWANWDSDLTPWNAMDKGPKRDLVGDLGKALRKHGLKFAPSYHRERHDTFFAKRLYVVDAEPQDDIAEEIRRVPEASSLYGPFGLTKEFVDDYVARWKEIQTKYQPDFLWIDDIPIWTRDGNQVLAGKAKPEVQYFYDQCRLMITDFMNDGAARGAEVYVNNKGGNRNWPAGVGCLEKDNLKLKVIGPKWESCTTFGTSFGYLEGDQYKSVASVIHEMVEVISRNGNFLVNIGPKPDGTIPAPQMERLMAMKRWLKINGEAIYGSRYWKESEQRDEDLAFTTNGKTLYALKLKKPDHPFVITGTAGWDRANVTSVRLLGSDAKVSWQMTSAGLKIVPPTDLGQSEHAWAFEVVTDQNQHHPNVIVRDEDKALRGTTKVDLEGRAAPVVLAHPPTKPFVQTGSKVVMESASSPDHFEQLSLPRASGHKVVTNQPTANEPLRTLTDGRIADNFGPIFGNGVHNGTYKMDLGAVRSVSAISSWSHNQAGRRGAQKFTIYGSDAATDPGWDLRKLTPLATVHTGVAKNKFTATSLRAANSGTLGEFRWIIWAVSPVTNRGAGENTAFQELSVELK